MGVLCLPFITGFLAAQTPTGGVPAFITHPRFSASASWLGPDELMMSDVPWAVDWYGRHSCITLSRDTQDDFSAVNDYLQPVKGIYLTDLTLDDKFFSNVLRSQHGGWSHLVLNFIIMDAADRGDGCRWQRRALAHQDCPPTPHRLFERIPATRSQIVGCGPVFHRPCALARKTITVLKSATATALELDLKKLGAQAFEQVDWAESALCCYYPAHSSTAHPQTSSPPITASIS